MSSAVPDRHVGAELRCAEGGVLASAGRAASVVVLGVLAWFVPASRAQDTGASVLTRAGEVLNLSEEQAARSLPVRLRGVVLGDAPPVGKAFVVWDGSESLYVRKPEPDGAPFQRGDRVELEGSTGSGGFAPLLYMSAGRKIGAGPLPEPRELSFEELMAGQFDAQWVRVRGIVRQCVPSEAWSGRWKLALATGDQLIAVHVNSELSPERLVDAAVVVDGLFFNQHNVSRQFVRAVLFVPEGVPIAIRTAAPADPFAAPVRPVGSLLRFERQGRYGHRVHVRGQVLHQLPGRGLWIRDGDRGLRVAALQPERLAVGDTVEVLGFPVLGSYTPRMEDAVFRRVGAGEPPRPVEPADVRAAIAHDSDLVAIAADLVEVRRLPERVALALDWHGERIAATLPLADDVPAPAGWTPGSLVRATGICAVPEGETAPESGRWEPRAFELLLRSAADLQVLQPAPWWTPPRMLRALGALAVGLVLVIAGVMLAARRRLREQRARRAQAEAEFAAILAERSRLAREIHDTLAQGLAAVSIQLELAKTTPPDDRAAVGRHVETAHRLVRGSLADARASIWNMRAQMLETHDLGGAIEGILRQLAEGTPVAARCTVTGVRRRLPPVTENELLRIGQEAIVNAMKHAAPRQVDVRLEFSEQAVELMIADDGAGFDPDQAVARAGSYGLAGMRERAARIDARLTLESAPGRGTRVTVNAPAPA